MTAKDTGNGPAKKGKLIVLDGLDGCGKSTQFKMLKEALCECHVEFATVKFPVYDSPGSTLVRRYLDGAYGDPAADANVFAVAMCYALDRYDAWVTDYGGWRSVYESGGIVIADRYTSSNIIHQWPRAGAGFLDWLKRMEHTLLKLPKPDSTIFFDMPPGASRDLMRKRSGETGERLDGIERNEGYCAVCYRSAKLCAKAFCWDVVECLDGNGAVRSAREIHSDVLSIVERVVGRHGATDKNIDVERMEGR